MILRRGIPGTGLDTAPDPTLAGTDCTGLAEQIPTLRTNATTNSSTTFPANFISDGLWIWLFVIREKIVPVKLPLLKYCSLGLFIDSDKKRSPSGLAREKVRVRLFAE